MAESTISVSYPDLCREVADLAGMGDVYNEGTVTISSGVVTFSVATVPADWPANGTLEAGGSTYTVNTRDSTSQVTLNDTSVNEASAINFVLFQRETVEEWRRINRAVRDSLEQVYTPEAPHQWSWMYPVDDIVTVAPYSTGTVAVSAAGVVTGTSTVFPSWAANGKITVSNTPLGTVNTRDSDTQLTLDDTSVTAIAAGASYELAQADFPLPDDFGGVEGSMTFFSADNGQNKVYEVGEERIRHLRSMDSNSSVSTYPLYFAVRPIRGAGGANFTNTTEGQRFECMFWPEPDAEYTITYKKIINPDMLAPANPYPYGGMSMSGLFKASAVASAELLRDGARGAYWDDFQRRLTSAVQRDKRNKPRNLGYNGNRERTSRKGGRFGRFENFDLITYGGTIYDGS